MYAASGQSVLVVPEPSTISAGSLNTVKLRVINAGEVPLQSVRVVLSLQKSQLSVDPSVLDVGELQPGEERAFAVRVLAPATASSSESISYQVLYAMPGGSAAVAQGAFTLSVVLPSAVTVTGLELVPQKPQVGSTLILAVTLVNDGVLPVYAVNVTVQASGGLAPLRAPYAYLGQLNPQVLTSVPFSFRAQAEGVQELRVVLSLIHI